MLGSNSLLMENLGVMNPYLLYHYAWGEIYG